MAAMRVTVPLDDAVLCELVLVYCDSNHRCPILRATPLVNHEPSPRAGVLVQLVALGRDTAWPTRSGTEPSKLRFHASVEDMRGNHRTMGVAHLIPLRYAGQICRSGYYTTRRLCITPGTLIHRAANPLPTAPALQGPSIVDMALAVPQTTPSMGIKQEAH